MKFLFYFILFISLSNADLVDNKIENLIGVKTFIKHKNLINNLTSDKKQFYIGNRLNYTKILNILKRNGFLDLRFKKPQNVYISFKINQYPLKGIKILKDILSTLGYSYYFTKNIIYDKNKLIWKIYFKSEYMLDPYIFNKELIKNEVIISDIKRVNNTNWVYDIDITNMILKDTLKVQTNEKIILKKPLKPYMLRINEAKQLTIKSRRLNHWFPFITFFDKNMDILKVIKKNRFYRGYKTEIPKGSYYIKIDDSFTLLNIKRGLTIILQ